MNNEKTHFEPDAPDRWSRLQDELAETKAALAAAREELEEVTSENERMLRELNKMLEVDR